MDASVFWISNFCSIIHRAPLCCQGPGGPTLSDPHKERRFIPRMYHEGFPARFFVTKRVPGGMIRLLSALALHQLSNPAPPEVWLAIDRNAHKPQVNRLP